MIKSLILGHLGLSHEIIIQRQIKNYLNRLQILAIVPEIFKFEGNEQMC